MAIYYCNVQVISRGHGRNSVASAAYRARDKLVDERTGTTDDYRKRGGLSHAEILLPEHAPKRFKNRQTLWAEVEKREERINSQLSREFVVGLQKELSDEENIKLVRDYAQEQFIKRGMIADICIHNLGSQNPHAHIMLTMRHVDENGFKKEKKSAREWNKKDLLLKQRAVWSEHVNRALEQAKIQERVDHRSYKERGINKEATVHLGWYAHNLENQGIKTELGDINRKVKTKNEERIKLEERIKILEEKLRELKKQENLKRQQIELERKTQEFQKSAKEFQSSFKELEKTIEKFNEETEPEKRIEREQQKIREIEILKKRDRGMGY